MLKESKAPKPRFLNIETSIDRIEAIDALAQYHRFSDDFAEHWIQKLSLLPPHQPLAASLPHIIEFESRIDTLFCPKRPIILLGNYGAGKTLVAQKLATLLSNKDHKVHIHSLNQEQQEKFSTIDSVESLFEESTSVVKDYTIIDTPGLNPYAEPATWAHDILKYSTRLHLFWVQASGIDCNEALMLSEKLGHYPLKGLFMTKLDTAVHHGACLTLPYYLDVPLTFFNDAPSPTSPLLALTPEKLMHFLNMRG